MLSESARCHEGNQGMAELPSDTLESRIREFLTVLRASRAGDVDRHLFEPSRLFLGLVSENRSNLDLLVAKFREVMRTEVDSREAHLYLANLLERNGDFDGAITEYREAVCLDPADFFAHSQIARLFEKEGDIERTIDEYREACRLNPKTRWERQQLARLLEMRGAMDEAIAAWREVLSLDPNDIETRLALGRSLEMKGDPESAIGEYCHALRSSPEALSLPPSGRNTWWTLSWGFQVKARPKTLRGLIHRKMSNALLKTRGLADVRANFPEVLHFEVSLVLGRVRLALAALRRRKWRQAAVELWTAARPQPACAALHDEVAEGLALLGDLRGAIIQYRRALLLDPDDAVLHNKLGLALLQRAQTHGSYRKYGIALFAKGYGDLDLEEAIREFRRALGLRRDYAEAWWNLGSILTAGPVDPSESDAAVRAFCKGAFEGLPEHYIAEAHSNLGKFLLSRGDLQGAISELREVLRLRPGDALAHSRLAEALLKKEERLTRSSKGI